MAQTAEVMENQAQEFIDYAIKKGFTISQEFIDAVIFELKTVNLWRESVSLKSYKMGLAAAIDSARSPHRFKSLSTSGLPLQRCKIPFRQSCLSDN